jgi:hypothetical protein
MGLEQASLSLALALALGLSPGLAWPYFSPYFISSLSPRRSVQDWDRPWPWPLSHYFISSLFYLFQPQPWPLFFGPADFGTVTHSLLRHHYWRLAVGGLAN